MAHTTMLLAEYPHSLISPAKAAQMDDVPYTPQQLGTMGQLQLIKTYRVSRIRFIERDSLLFFMKVLADNGLLPTTV